MNTKNLALCLVISSVLTACNTTQPRLNHTTVKTGFIVMANEQEAQQSWVKEDERILARDVRLTSAAILNEPYTFKVKRNYKTIEAGTYMFGAQTNYNQDVSTFMRRLRDKDPELFRRITLPDGDTIEEKKANQKEAVSQAVKKMEADASYSGLRVFCTLTDSSVSVDEFATALLTLGLSLIGKSDGVFCLQDTDLDGKFDRHWESNLTFSFPPTVSTIYNDVKIEPVSYTTIANDDIKPIGQLWVELDINKKATKATVSGKIGTDKKSVSFDNLRNFVTVDNLNKKHNFFGATYTVNELDASGKALVSITPTDKNQIVSLSKTVTYGSRSTYIPIFVP